MQVKGGFRVRRVRPAKQVEDFVEGIGRGLPPERGDRVGEGRRGGVVVEPLRLGRERHRKTGESGIAGDGGDERTAHGFPVPVGRGGHQRAGQRGGQGASVGAGAVGRADGV